MNWRTPLGSAQPAAACCHGKAWMRLDRRLCFCSHHIPDQLNKMRNYPGQTNIDVENARLMQKIFFK